MTTTTYTHHTIFNNLQSKLGTLDVDSRDIFFNFCTKLTAHINSFKRHYFKAVQVFSINEMLNSELWDMHYRQSTWLENVALSQPDRFNRIQEYAILGLDGSSHREIIQDWRDFMSYNHGVFMYELTRELNLLFSSENTDYDYDIIIDAYVETMLDYMHACINDVENWHDKNGSLDTIPC